jgi:dienelactone hydrolase
VTPFPNAWSTLGVIGRQHVAITPDLTHHEVYTWDGLLTLLWHGPDQPRHVVLACGGALGGLLGPANGLYHDLGVAWAAAEPAITTIRVGYRVPNDLDRCLHDLLAVAQAAADRGAERFVVLGHSFGGAVAIQAGAALGPACAGVVTFATQSGGCEDGEALGEAGVPVLHFHGDEDTILPFMASQMVQMLTGGELVLLPGADHSLAAARETLWDRVVAWVPEQLAAPGPAS